MSTKNKRMTAEEKKAQEEYKEKMMAAARRADIRAGFAKAKEIAVKFGFATDWDTIKLISDRLELDDAYLPAENQALLEAALAESIGIAREDFGEEASRDIKIVIDIHDRIYEWGEHAPDLSDEEEEEEEDEDENE